MFKRHTFLVDISLTLAHVKMLAEGKSVKELTSVVAFDTIIRNAKEPFIAFVPATQFKREPSSFIRLMSEHCSNPNITFVVCGEGSVPKTIKRVKFDVVTFTRGINGR